MNQNSQFKICWYSACPHCKYAIQYKIETPLTEKDLKNLWSGSSEFFVDGLEDVIFYIEDPTFSSDGKKNYISQYNENDYCYQCHRPLIIFTSAKNKLNIQNFVEKVLWDFMTDRTKSIWVLFKKYPKIDSAYENFANFVGGSNLFSVGGMYNDNRIYWCTMDEVNPYSRTIYSIFDWIINEYKPYFVERISEIKYDGEYVVSKLIEESSLNYIDTDHPQLLMNKDCIENGIFENKISNASSDFLLKKLNSNQDMFIA